MRKEKKIISDEYVERLQNSPFFIVTDYSGMSMPQFSELRTALAELEAEIHVFKNTMFKIAAEESGIKGVQDIDLKGQLAVTTGQRDISSAAKALKAFHKESERCEIRFGYMDSERLDKEDLLAIADLPPLEQLRAQLVGVLAAPATTLTRLIQTPASQLAQVLKAKIDKDGGTE